MKSEASTYATVPIADSFDGLSSVYAIDCKTKTDVELIEGDNISFTQPGIERFKHVVRETLNFFGEKSGCNISIISELSPKKGLGFDESVASSIMLSLVGALAKKKGTVYELRIDKYVREQVLEVDGLFVDFIELIRHLASDKLRFDRMFCSLYGGFILADNNQKKLLRRGGMESFYAAVCYGRPCETKNDLFKCEAQLVWDEALKGNLYSASKLYSMFFSRKRLEQALSKGAQTACVNREGTTVSLCRDKKTAEKISKLVYMTANNKAHVNRKPHRIIKVNEFLQLKGEKKYYWV